MANLLQSDATTQQVAPTFYNNYLSTLATDATKAAKDAQFAGAQPLQTKAFENVEAAGKAFQPTLTSAESALNQAASTASPMTSATPYFQTAGKSPAQLAREYMDPYTQSVVNNLGDAGARNIRMNLSPAATAGAVGSGQFGSKRGAEVLGQTIGNANRDVLNAQQSALNTGYQNALTAAGQQNQLQATMGKAAGDLTYSGQQADTATGQALGQLATVNQDLNLKDINALSTLGQQQQTIKQNEQNFPLTNLSTLSGIMAGQQIPMTTTQTVNGSPLSAIAAMGSGTGALFQTPTGGGKSLFEQMTGQASLGGLTNLAGSAISKGVNSGLDYVKDWWNSTPDGTYVPGGSGSGASSDYFADASGLGTGQTPAYDSSGTLIGYNDASGNFFGTND
jgi:hypothetical protein